MLITSRARSALLFCLWALPVLMRIMLLGFSLLTCAGVLYSLDCNHLSVNIISEGLCGAEILSFFHVLKVDI